MRKTTTARRPDLILEYTNEKKIWIVDMACPNEKNITSKYNEKLQKYQQLAFEIRERRPGFWVYILPVVIGCLGGGMERCKDQVSKIILDKKCVNQVCEEMLKTVLLYQNEGTLM